MNKIYRIKLRLVFPDGVMNGSIKGVGVDKTSAVKDAIKNATSIWENAGLLRVEVI